MSTRRVIFSTPADAPEKSHLISIPRWRFAQLLETERQSRKLESKTRFASQPEPPRRLERMTPDLASKIVDGALAGGQVEAADADRWRSALEADPSPAISQLAKLPKDEERAARNFIDAQDAAYRAHAESRLFIPAAEVV